MSKINMGVSLRVSGSSSVRQPEGADKWFAEPRARWFLRKAGFTVDPKTEGKSLVDYVRGNKVYASVYSGRDGLIFTLCEQDDRLEDIAYAFGAQVNKKYSG
jgi:hypothetical protein